MAIADDFSINASKDIRYTGSGTNYTGIELYRFLQDLADDAVASGDDLIDITETNPATRSTDNIFTLLNGYNIDDDASEHIYDASFTQASGDTVYSGLVVVGAVESGTNLQIVRDGALLTNYWGTGLNADAANNILLRIMVKTRENGVDINSKLIRVQARELGDKYSEFTLTLGEGNSTAAIFTSSDLNNATAAGTIATWSSITNTEGLRLIDITGDGSTEEYYSEWNIGSQSINDTYERTKWIQRRGTSETIHGMNGELFRGITHSFAYDAETGTGPATNDSYSWGLKFNYDNEASGPFTVGEAIHEDTAIPVWKGRIIALDDNGTDGSMVVSIESGTVSDNDSFTGQSSGATADVDGSGTGQATGGGRAILLAVDDDGTTGNLYVQLITGTAPADNAILYESTDVANTVTVNGTVTSRTISPEFLGATTGTNIIGAYGIGFEAADVGASDQLFDLTNTLRTPPNNQTFTVSNLVSGEDRVLVTQNDGSDEVDYDQLELNTTLNGAAETSVVVTTTIPSDTPSSGTIRVTTDSGLNVRVAYSSYTGSTFTITSTDFSTDNATAANNVFISYIDETASGTTASFSTVYGADRSLLVKVRNGTGTIKIVPFKTSATFTSTGGSVTTIRTADV